jgi:DNA-directed RNA polymerase specialized sigma24 family protein
MAGADRPAPSDEQPIIDLVPLVRRVVAARVRDPQLVDDLVQETLVRVMAARARVEADTLAPYAAVTARNLVASVARSDTRARRMAHLRGAETVVVGIQPEVAFAMVKFGINLESIYTALDLEEGLALLDRLSTSGVRP